MIIRHANVTGNRGYGVYVNTTRGYVSIENSHVNNNLGDGIKYHYHDQVRQTTYLTVLTLKGLNSTFFPLSFYQRPETKVVDGVDVHDFCTYSTTYSQTYPFLMVAEQEEASLVDR